MWFIYLHIKKNSAKACSVILHHLLLAGKLLVSEKLFDGTLDGRVHSINVYCVVHHLERSLYWKHKPQNSNSMQKKWIHLWSLRQHRKPLKTCDILSFSFWIYKTTMLTTEFSQFWIYASYLHVFLLAPHGK